MSRFAAVLLVGMADPTGPDIAALTLPDGPPVTAVRLADAPASAPAPAPKPEITLAYKVRRRLRRLTGRGPAARPAPRAYDADVAPGTVPRAVTILTDAFASLAQPLLVVAVDDVAALWVRRAIEAAPGPTAVSGTGPGLRVLDGTATAAMVADPVLSDDRLVLSALQGASAWRAPSEPPRLLVGPRDVEGRAAGWAAAIPGAWSLAVVADAAAGSWPADAVLSAYEDGSADVRATAAGLLLGPATAVLIEGASVLLDGDDPVDGVRRHLAAGRRVGIVVDGDGLPLPDGLVVDERVALFVTHPSLLAAVPGARVLPVALDASAFRPRPAPGGSGTPTVAVLAGAPWSDDALDALQADGRAHVRRVAGLAPTLQCALVTGADVGLAPAGVPGPLALRALASGRVVVGGLVDDVPGRVVRLDGREPADVLSEVLDGLDRWAQVPLDDVRERHDGRASRAVLEEWLAGS